MTSQSAMLLVIWAEYARRLQANECPTNAGPVFLPYTDQVYCADGTVWGWCR